MLTFTKKCFCQKTITKFYCFKNFNEDVVDIFYCPLCSDRASTDSLLVRIIDIPKMAGVWAIKYNSAVLKEIDPKFEDSDSYYENLFRDGYCTFEAVWKKRKKPTYEIIGIKIGRDKIKQESTLSGPDYLTIRKDGKPVKLPKKAWTRGEESGPRQSGYKGHR